ncbi:MAG: substrate-binding domain-containing protein [Chloroflexi bacterium]|nr:substrate-binding domain-containing protein [Chloroflexota bacterium]
MPDQPQSRGGGPSLREISSNAANEGEVALQSSIPLTEDWRQRFESAFDLEFGLPLKVTLGGDAPDVVIATDVDMALRFSHGELTGARWDILFGAQRRAMMFDTGGLAIAQELLRPILGPGAPQVASSWDGLLDPRLKGRLGVASAMDPWARLSLIWGQDKTQSFVDGLAKQQPIRGSEADLARQLAQGSIDALAAGPDSAIRTFKDARILDVDPAAVRSLVAAPVKSAKHPNAAVLFVGFLATQEGQTLWQQFSGQSSVFDAGSALSQYLQTRQYSLAEQSFLTKDGPGRMAGYAKLLGYGS